MFTSCEVGGNKIAQILPCELLLFFPPLLPCLWACSDTSLSIRPLANCLYHCHRLREVLHLAENSLQDLSLWYSSDVTFDRCFLESKSSDSQLCASPNDLSWLVVPCVHVKDSKRQSSAAVTQQPNALGKTTLVSGSSDWLNCYNTLLMFLQIRRRYCSGQLEAKMARTKATLSHNCSFLWQYKNILNFIILDVKRIFCAQDYLVPYSVISRKLYKKVDALFTLLSFNCRADEQCIKLYREILA